MHPLPTRSETNGAQSLALPVEERARKRSQTTNDGRAADEAFPPSEQGYIMLIAIFLLAVLVLSLAIAAPQVAKSIQRDRDLETFHRGQQYRRAIQLYYRRFKAYPPNLDALVKTTEVRFLRKRYIDPITGKDDWKPVMFGQNKTPTALGFFGQPLAGGATSIAGVGPSGGNGLQGSQSNGGSSFGGSSFGGSSSGGSSFGGSSFGGSSFGGSSFGGSSFGGSSFGGSSGGSSFGGSSFGGSSFGGSSSGSSSDGSSSSTSASDSGSSQSPSSGTTGSSDNSTGSTGTGASGTSSGSGLFAGSGQTGQTFGGAGIIGFSPASPKQSILVYKKKNHYNEWEFTYDPLSEMQTVGSGNAGAIGQPAGSTSTPVGSSGFGNSSSFGNSSGFGNSSIGGYSFGNSSFGSSGGNSSSGSSGSGNSGISTPTMPPDTPAPQ